MKCLGLDPASKCGWAVSGEVEKVGAYGLWLLTNSRDTHPGRRLERFRRHLYNAKREFQFQAIGIEDASFGSHNPSTQALHNELAGIAKLCAAEWDIPFQAFKPKHIKKWFTGNGRAEKSQMVDEVNSQFKLDIVDDNVADAIAVMRRTVEFYLTMETYK